MVLLAALSTGCATSKAQMQALKTNTSVCEVRNKENWAKSATVREDVAKFGFFGEVRGDGRHIQAGLFEQRIGTYGAGVLTYNNTKRHTVRIGDGQATWRGRAFAVEYVFSPACSKWEAALGVAALMKASDDQNRRRRRNL